MKFNLKKYNPYTPLAMTIGYLFYPLTFIKTVKQDLLPLVKLVHNLFINNVMSTFLAFWYPFIFIGILGQVGAAQFMVFNIASFIPMVVGVQVMPSILLLLKQSSVLKRIGATETKTWHITAAFIFYFSIVSLVSVAMNVGLGSSIYGSDIDFDIVNWGQVIITTVIGTIVGLSFGMFISGIISDTNTLMVVGLLLTLPGAFLTGQFLPPNLVNEWGPMRYVSFIFPQRIATVMMQTAVNDGSIFSTEVLTSINYASLQEIVDLIESGVLDGGILQDEDFMNEYIFELTNKTEIIMAWALAPVYTIGFGVLTSYTFKWGVR